MKIILIASIPNLGKIGDVIEVKNGYARNFLIPGNKAICFTSANYKAFESKKHEFEQANLKDLDSASRVKAKIEGKDIIVIENASDDGRLYGSVNSVTIAAKINNILGEKLVSRNSIFLKKPIKEIGLYEVKLNLHSEAAFNIRLIVTRSESEIDAILKVEKNGANVVKKSEDVVSLTSEIKSDKSKKIRKKKPSEE